MQVHTQIDHLPQFKNAVITIGTFDGVHRGHQQLIDSIKKLSADKNGESVLITFEPHPRSVVFPQDQSLRILSTLDEKIDLLRAFDIDHLVVVPFTKEFSLMSARDYVEKFLIEKFHPAVIVIGYNHQFGHHRDGNIELLRKLAPDFHFDVKEIPKQLVDDIEVSSTRIRIALTEGDVSTASHLLGHSYSIEGIVEKGNQLGRRLGFPTANIRIENKYKLIPADGIYAAQCFLNEQKLDGIMSIGMRPTVDGRSRTQEVYLFNFNEDIYGQKIKAALIEWIRDEIKFPTLDELVEAMKKDVVAAGKILSNHT